MRPIKNKNFFSIFFCLAIILLLESFYIVASYFRKNIKTTYIGDPPFKRAQISPLTGNLLDSGRRSPIQVIYSPNEANEPLSGINNADLIFEYLSENGKPAYTAIFHDKPPEKTSPVKQLGDISIKKLPTLSFCRDPQKVYENKRAATYIFITLNYNISSNFLYENGFYKHFKDTAMDFDTGSAEPVLVSNIIIQFTDNYEGMENVSQLGMGKGLLFCGGKIIDIHWQNDGNSPIKVEDENGNPVQLQNGSTWWVIINKNCPVAFN